MPWWSGRDVGALESSADFSTVWKEFLLLEGPNTSSTEAATQALLYLGGDRVTRGKLAFARKRVRRYQIDFVEAVIRYASNEAPPSNESWPWKFLDFHEDFYMLNKLFPVQQDDKGCFDKLEPFCEGLQRLMSSPQYSSRMEEYLQRMLEKLTYFVVNLCASIQHDSKSTPERFVAEEEIKLVLVIANLPFFEDFKAQKPLIELFQFVEHLSSTLKDCIIKCEVPLKLLRRTLAAVHQVLTLQLSFAHASGESIEIVKAKCRRTVKLALKFLKLLYKANTKRAEQWEKTFPLNREKLPEPALSVEFYNDGINASAGMIQYDFIQYQKEINRVSGPFLRQDAQEPIPADDFTSDFDIVNHSFVLDASNKRTYFLSHVTTIQERRRFGAFLGLLNSTTILLRDPYLLLRVRRSDLIYDSLRKLTATVSTADLQKPLKVVFDDEAGVDEGGVTKEFFQLLVEQLFNVDYGMFEYNDDTRLFWFNPSSFENMLQYELIGVVLGLAIFNGVILNLNFPRCVYKKLLGSPGSFDDLQEIRPEVYKSFCHVLEMNAQEVENCELTFSAEVNRFGHVEEQPLSPDIDPSRPVTIDNREEFVTLYADWFLNKSIEPQFEAFRKGFRKCIDNHLFRLLDFQPEELALVICGSPDFDLESLESVTQYQDGYTKDSETIKLFWEVAHSLSDEEKKKLLFFVTGSDRVPILGLSSLNFFIGKNGTETERVPTAHTCFNYLLLPDYKDKEKLRRYLAVALENHTGFGLR